MKKHLFALCFGLLVFPVVGNAGNMFGPAAFRNGSPLSTGNDGTYQATARAENVTGIFRFAYSGGSQTTTASQNSWIFFVNGRVAKGSVVANLNESNIDGILDAQSAQGSAQSGNNTSTVITLPYVQIFDSGSSSSGTFSGKLNLKSPSGEFSGNGILMGTPATTSNVIGIGNESIPTFDPLTGLIIGSFETGNITISNGNFTTSASSTQNTNFKFRGVRTNTSTTAATSAPATGTASN